MKNLWSWLLAFAFGAAFAVPFLVIGYSLGKH